LLGVFLAVKWGVPKQVRDSIPLKWNTHFVFQQSLPYLLTTVLGRFRRYVDGLTEGQDPNKIRIVVEW